MIRNIRLILYILICFLFIIETKNAEATVQYAEREQKPCSYCHISPTPGLYDSAANKNASVDCNARGIYYETHNLSFAGYVEKSIEAMTPKSPFKFGWVQELRGHAERIAAADVKGDGMMRLLTLSPQENESQLEIWKWDGTNFEKETSFTINAPPDMLQTGHFAGAAKPLLIVTGDGMRYWNGSSFVFRPASSQISLIGAARLKDGVERLIIGTDQTSLKAYRVDLNAAGSSWLIDPVKVPGVLGTDWAEIHGDAKTLEKLGMPDTLSAGGFFGYWSIANHKNPFLYLPKINQDFDIYKDPKDPSNPKFKLKSQTWCVGMINAVSLQDSFYTPILAGKIYDVTRTGPRPGDGPGLLILADLPLSKSRALYFFPIQ